MFEPHTIPTYILLPHEMYVHVTSSEDAAVVDFKLKLS